MRGKCLFFKSLSLTKLISSGQSLKSMEPSDQMPNLLTTQALRSLEYVEDESYLRCRECKSFVVITSGYQYMCKSLVVITSGYKYVLN